MSGDQRIAKAFWAACGAAAMACALSLATLAILAFAGCSAAPYGTGSQRYRIPWPVSGPVSGSALGSASGSVAGSGAPGEYRLQTVTIRTFDRPESLSGKWAKVFVAPYVMNGELSGGSPIGRFIRDADGVLRPADLVTRQATTIYAHFEKLREMEEAVGLAASAPWPAKIGVRTRMREERGDAVDNALYDGPLDAVLMVPYAQAGLPISYNAGILAHERFHADFYAIVLKPLAASARRAPAARPWDEWDDAEGPAVRSPMALDLVGSTSLGTSANLATGVAAASGAVEDDANDLLLRAINEGLADVWGWAYSGDDAFVGRSLASAGKARRLDGEVVGISSSEKWLDDLAAHRARTSDPAQRRNNRLAQAYALGTQYARLFRRLAEEQVDGDGSAPWRTAAGEAPAPRALEARRQAARSAAARAIARALPKIAQAYMAPYKAREALDPRAPAREFAAALLGEGVASASACQTAREFFETPSACAALSAAVLK